MTEPKFTLRKTMKIQSLQLYNDHVQVRLIDEGYGGRDIELQFRIAKDEIVEVAMAMAGDGTAEISVSMPAETSEESE